jgi:hypothetical protein
MDFTEIQENELPDKLSGKNRIMLVVF